MQRDNIGVVTRKQESILSTHKVLRNTYMLLSLTFLFSAFMAYVGLALHAKPISPLLFIVGVYGLMFLTQSLRNSIWGLASIFAFTGLLGYGLAPMLQYYLTAFSNGGQIIATALGATGVIFFSLSAYTLTTKKDFSYLGGFLFIGVMIAMLAMIGGIFFHIPGLNLAISALFVLISSGMILFQTSQIIHGGERNYIMATITLFVSIYNLFVSLLQLLGAFGGRD